LAQGGPGYRVSSLSPRWEAILKTAETTRTRVPQAKVDYANAFSAYLERFFRGRHSDILAACKDLVIWYDFASHRKLVDLCGESGGVAIALARVCPSLHARVIGLTSATPITLRIVDETDLARRIDGVSGNVVAGQLTGNYDVAVMRSFIQVLSPEHAGQATNSVGRVIVPGGMVYVIGAILDNSHITPAETAVLNLNFLNSNGDAQAYTEQEYDDWLFVVGFGNIQHDVQANGISVMISKNQE